MCHRCLKHWFPELGALYSTSKEWQGVKQQKLYLSLSFFVSQLDHFHNVQKTLRLEGPCQHCSGTAQLDLLLKPCLLAGEERHIQRDLVLLRNPSSHLHSWMECLHSVPFKNHPKTHTKPSPQNQQPPAKPANLSWIILRVIHGYGHWWVQRDSFTWVNPRSTAEGLAQEGFPAACAVPSSNKCPQNSCVGVHTTTL